MVCSQTIADGTKGMQFLRHLFLAGLLALSPHIADGETWQIQVPAVPFDDDSPTTTIAYQPLDHAAKPWRICVTYPHLKDAYWLSVNYGMVEEANRLGVSFDLYEAGGYPNLTRQIEQVEACGKRQMDAMILGAAAGRAIAMRHPKGSAPVRLAWFPGPKGAGWVQFVERGFMEALAESSAQIVATRFGDTGLEQQVLLVEDVLDTVPDVDYLVGSGPMAEADVSLLRARGLTQRIGVVSTYVSHGVYRGIKRNRIQDI